MSGVEDILSQVMVSHDEEAPAAADLLRALKAGALLGLPVGAGGPGLAAGGGRPGPLPSPRPSPCCW